MKKQGLTALAWLALGPGLILLPSALHALEKQPSSVYHARRVALAGKLQGGVAILFAAEEPALDFMPYRQDSDFYYLAGWNEPGAALVIVSDAPQAAAPRAYREILFLPARNLRMEAYTGVKMDAATPGSSIICGRNRALPRPRRCWALRQPRWEAETRRGDAT
jgi:Xaa-Pro aminopeptidase